jgi:hypothetical protein
MAAAKSPYFSFLKIYEPIKKILSEVSTPIRIDVYMADKLLIPKIKKTIDKTNGQPIDLGYQFAFL